MALSEGLQEASDALDTVSDEVFPTSYNRAVVNTLVSAMRSIITEVDALNNP